MRAALWAGVADADKTRQRLQQVTEAVGIWAENQPEVFAGMHIEQSAAPGEGAGARVVVGIAGMDVETARVQLGLATAGSPLLVLVQRPLSVSVLRHTQDRLTAVFMPDGQDCARVCAIGADEPASLMEVTLTSTDSSLEQEIRHEAQGINVRFRYGRVLPC